MFEVDRAEILVLADNWVDMLLAESEGEGGLAVHRCGLVDHFRPGAALPQAEFGLSLLVRVWRGERSQTIAFDAGLSGRVLEHNLAALGVDAASIDHVVISHGHPDHYGGVYELVRAVGRPVPVSTHEDAFLPRYAVMPDGQVSPFYNAELSAERVEAAGGRVVLGKEPLDLWGGVMTTGEIPREVDFEGPRAPGARQAPGLYQVSREGRYGLDEVWDEQGLVVAVKDRGLVVLTGCAHAGVVNTVTRARELTGMPLLGVLGGFHLGFPTTPTENVNKTVAALGELSPALVMPMHCSGLGAHAQMRQRLADSYVQPAVGTRIRVGAG